jgi:hypothetical protein
VYYFTTIFKFLYKFARTVQVSIWPVLIPLKEKEKKEKVNWAGPTPGLGCAASGAG